MASRAALWARAFMYVCIGIAALIAGVSTMAKVVPAGGYVDVIGR
jgi:hypothetical protein